MLEKIIEFLDPGEDIKRVSKGDCYKSESIREEILASVKYAGDYFSRLPKHFYRGAVLGAVSGGIYSLFSGDVNDLKHGAFLGAGFDYLQFTFRWVGLLD